MTPDHLSDIALLSYENGQMWAAKWEGLMPVPVPEIYIQYAFRDAIKFSQHFHQMHRNLVLENWRNGFLDTIRKEG